MPCYEVFKENHINSYKCCKEPYQPIFFNRYIGTETNELPKALNPLQSRIPQFIRSELFLKDTHPNLRRSHNPRLMFSYQSHIPTVSPRGTEWQEQLFRLVKLTPSKVGQPRGQALTKIESKQSGFATLDNCFTPRTAR